MWVNVNHIYFFIEVGTNFLSLILLLKIWEQNAYQKDSSRKLWITSHSMVRCSHKIRMVLITKWKRFCSWIHAFQNISNDIWQTAFLTKAMLSLKHKYHNIHVMFYTVNNLLGVSSHIHMKLSSKSCLTSSGTQHKT